MRPRFSTVVVSLALLALVVIAGTSPVGAAKRSAHPQQVQSLDKRALHLMDSGTPAVKGGLREPTNTLNPPVATPMMVPDTYLWYGTGTAMQGGFMGNCFDMSDVPTGWWPLFRITGMWANQLHTPPNQPATYNQLMVARNDNGNWPGSGTITLTWNSIGTHTSPYATGLVGGRSLWGGTASGGIPVQANQRFAAGLLILQGWGNEIGLVSGAGGGVNYCSFVGPPVFAVSRVYPDSTWLAGYDLDVMAGVYVSGATVPVELQSYHVE